MGEGQSYQLQEFDKKPAGVTHCTQTLDLLYFGTAALSTD